MQLDDGVVAEHEAQRPGPPLAADDLDVAADRTDGVERPPDHGAKPRLEGTHELRRDTGER